MENTARSTQSTILVIAVFLTIKAIQLITSYFFAVVLGNDQGAPIFMYGIAFLAGMLLIGYLTKLLFPPIVFRIIQIAILPCVILASFFNLSVGILFLAFIFLYMLVIAEAQVVHTLGRFRDIPRIVLLICALLPLLFSYFISSGIHVSQLYYIASTVFAFVASYSVRISGGDKTRGTIGAPWPLGVFSLLFAGALFYVTRRFPSDIDMFTLAMFVAFYSLGSASIYSALNEYVRRVPKA